MKLSLRRLSTGHLSAGPRWGSLLENAAHDFGPSLSFALQVWGSVCLAFFAAFWLEFDKPYWAGMSAAIAYLPALGASLRKASFLMLGNVIGATIIVIIAGFFPQDRLVFLGLLALWVGICTFASTQMRNTASYGAACAGYSAALVAGVNLGATGGASPDIFMVAVSRVSEICLGIACAGLVRVATDFGGAQQQLAGSFAGLAAEIADGFTRMLASEQLLDTQTERRELLQRVISLDPMMDQVVGESAQIRSYEPTLQMAVLGAFQAGNGWRAVAEHLHTLPAEKRKKVAESILNIIPSGLRSDLMRGPSAQWIADPLALRRMCEETARKLVSHSAETPSQRLVADETAKVMIGFSQMLEGLALLADAPGYTFVSHRRLRSRIADWLPAITNGVRAFATVGVAALFWVATAWPNGVYTIIFSAVLVSLFAPANEQSYSSVIGYTLGAAGATVSAALVKFTVLPHLSTFLGFCLAIGLVLVPTAFLRIWSQQAAVRSILTVWGLVFLPLLQTTNVMTYDTEQFYNFALSVFAGCTIAALAFRLLPSLPAASRAHRLLALTLRDLRRLASYPRTSGIEDWWSRIYARLVALPDQATPSQQTQLMAAWSVGTAALELRRVAPQLGVSAQVEAALSAFAQGDGALAITRLRELDDSLAAASGGEEETTIVLRARAQVLTICEALAAHSPYFESRRTVFGPV